MASDLSQTLQSSQAPSPWRWFSLDYLAVIVPTLVSIRLWSFQAAPEHALWSQIERLLILGLLFVSIWRYRFIRIPQMGFSYKWHMFWLFALSFASFIPLYLFDNQNPLRSFNTNMHMVYWLVYFVAYSTRFTKEDLLKFMVFVGVVWAVLTIGQQFTFPRVYFFSRADFENEVPFELRSGVYRFMVQGAYFGLPVSYYALNQYFNTRKLRFLGLLALMLIGVYCTATRQMMAVNLASLACLYLAYLWMQGRRIQLKILAFIAVPIAILLFFGESIFGQLLEKTSEEATTDNIRLKSLKFFLFDYWPHWSNFFLGNGVPHYYSEKGAFIRMMAEEHGYYASDVGLVGILHYKGILFVLVSLATVIRGIFAKVTTDTLFLNISFLGILMIIPLNPVFSAFDFFPFFCILCILQERSIHERQIKA